MKKSTLTFLTLAIPFSVFAHGGHGTGFMAGLTHPIFGIDHLLAIFTIGVIAFQFKDKNRWLLPLAFLVPMIIGGFMGVEAEGFPGEELVIKTSVFLLGLLLAFSIKVPPVVLMLALAIFGFFHGHAHGVEMPEESIAWQYFAGVILGVAIVVGLGYLKVFSWEKLFSKEKPVEYSKILGGFMMGAGVMLLLG